MYTLPSAGDVACPKCEAASGTPCLYIYNYANGRSKKWRKGRIGRKMATFHPERHAMFRDLRDSPERKAQLAAWLKEFGDIFEENPNGRV
jgi:hypothetical protein